MARKPIECELAGLRTPRERMWEAMCSLGCFTVAQVAERSRPIRKSAIFDYLQGLCRAGHVRQALESPFSAAQYEIASVSMTAPRVRRDGREASPALGVLAMWRAMKIRRVFDANQLTADTTHGDVRCTQQTAKSYLSHLKRAGYLRTERASRPGRLELYRLVRDTGPHPPAVTRTKAVFDRNTGELFGRRPPPSST